MASTPVVTLPGLASFDRRASPRSRQSSRANSRERRHFRPYPESNTRTVPVDQSRKRRAPDQDPDGDVGMHSDREQDGDDESSGSSPPPVKQEQVSDVEQSPSPPPTPGNRPVRYALPPPQTQFAPTPPASARRVSPPHISLPTLHNSHVTLPPLHLAPPEPYQEPLGARKRRRVTISGVAGSQGVPQRPLHRTVLERAGGYQPPSATPATPTAGGMVSPVVTPGFNLNSPGAISQVRDTIAIRMEQKALIEQRKNGGVAVPIRRPTPPPPEPQPQAPPALAEPPAPTQTLANRRGRASKLTIHTPNTSVSSIAADPTPRLSLAEAIRSAPPGVTRFDPASIRPPQPQPPRQPPKERSVSIRRMHANSTAAPPAPLAIVAPGQPLTLNAPAPPSSYIATPTRTQFPARTPRTAHPHPFRPPGPGSPPVSRDMFMAFYDAYAEAHTLRARLESVEKEVDRRVEMAVREMRDEIRMLREEIRRGHEHSHREQVHRERADTHRERADTHRGAETHRGPEPHRERAETHREREWEHPSRMGLRSGSLSVSQSPMQLDKRPLPPITEKSGEALFVGRLPGPGDRLPPPPGERVPGPGERVPGPGERPERHVPSHLSAERHPERLSGGERLSGPSDRLSGPGDRLPGPGERLPGPSDRLPGPSDRLSGPSDRLPGPGDRLPGQSDRLAGPTGPERLQPHPPRSALRKSPSGRSPPSRPPSVGVEGRVRGKARVRTRSPAGSKSGSA